jgi:hypothetical protein
VKGNVWSLKYAIFSKIEDSNLEDTRKLGPTFPSKSSTNPNPKITSEKENGDRKPCLLIIRGPRRMIKIPIR